MSAAKAVVTVESAIAPATKDFVKNAFIYVPYSMTHDATRRTLPSLYESFVTSWDILHYSSDKNKSLKINYLNNLIAGHPSKTCP
jgi:hypothetical protein